MGSSDAITPKVRSGTLHVNGADIYYEVRGSGPPVVFIQGATGDSGTFATMADQLADEFTVVTYDRRGNSRSTPPAGWHSTSIDEQADDAAGLISGLDLVPSIIFGTSGGAVILLNLLLRHPQTVRGAIIHEPPLIPVLSNPQETGAMLQAIIEETMAASGPRGTMERFLRLNAGDANVDNLDPSLRNRMLDNADVFFSIEMAAFTSYVPDAAELANSKSPVLILAGTESRGIYYYEAAEWVAKQFGTKLQESPGGHTPYLDHPKEFTQLIRPFLQNPLSTIPGSTTLGEMQQGQTQPHIA